MTETTAQDVLAILDLAEELGVKVWVDGGWAVDACLGRQTRRHADLDLALSSPDMGILARALRARGYSTAPRDDSRSTNFALGDEEGREVDLHAAELYPPGSLASGGEIAGCKVECVGPEWLVRFHSGYLLDEDDRADVLALCAAFRIELPAEYR